jgi:CheY-like chemotaxis protein
MIVNMADFPKEHILVVENDPQIIDLVSRQALQGAGYRVTIVTEAGEAITRILKDAPDMAIADLDLPGLNGRDLMVALVSQKIVMPVVVLAKEAAEGDILQAFRLGAADVILWPAREAEVITVVERVMAQVQERKESDRLSRRLQQMNLELRQRVRELATLFSIGKAVTSISDQNVLVERILEGAIYITKADLGWLLLKPENSRDLILIAKRGLPESFSARLNQAWDDGISPMAATSGEPLSIHSDLLKRFKVSSLGQSILIVPVKVYKKVAALLVVMRKPPLPFSTDDQSLLEAAADYAAISLSNVGLIQTVNDQACLSQSSAGTTDLSKRINDDLIHQGRLEIFPALETAEKAVQRLMKGLLPRWTTEQRQMLADVQRQLLKLHRISIAMFANPQADGSTRTSGFNLGELINQYSLSYQHYAQQNLIKLNIEMPEEAILVQADPEHIGHVLSGLLSHAIRICTPGGKIDLILRSQLDGMAEIRLGYSGDAIDPKAAEEFFSENGVVGLKSERFVGLGISLPLVKEIINQYQGKIWVDPNTGEGVNICFTLPGNIN